MEQIPLEKNDTAPDSGCISINNNKNEEIVGSSRTYHAQGADALTDSKKRIAVETKVMLPNSGSGRYFSPDISDKYAGVLTAEKRKYCESYTSIPAEVSTHIPNYESREAIPASKKSGSLKRLSLDPVTSWWKGRLHKGHIDVKYNIYRNRNNTSSENATSMGLDEFRPLAREGEDDWTRGYYKQSIYECFYASLSWADKRYMKDTTFWIKMRKLVQAKDEPNQVDNLQTSDNLSAEEDGQTNGVNNSPSSPKMTFPRYKRIKNCEGNDIRPWCVYFPPLDVCRQWYKENAMFDPDYGGFDEGVTDDDDHSSTNNDTNRMDTSNTQFSDTLSPANWQRVCKCRFNPTGDLLCRVCNNINPLGIKL